MDNNKDKFTLTEKQKREVNSLLIDNKIPIISPQQIRIFVNLHGYLTVKMNGQNTYKFLC